MSSIIPSYTFRHFQPIGLHEGTGFCRAPYVNMVHISADGKRFQFIRAGERSFGFQEPTAPTADDAYVGVDNGGGVYRTYVFPHFPNDYTSGDVGIRQATQVGGALGPVATFNIFSMQSMMHVVFCQRPESTLREWCVAQGAAPRFDMVATALATLLNQLQQAHSKGVYHGNLNTDTVSVLNGKLYITDFQGAAFSGNHGGQSHRPQRLLLSQAPESRLNRHTWSRTDSWGLAVICLSLCGYASVFDGPAEDLEQSESYAKEFESVRAQWREAKQDDSPRATALRAMWLRLSRELPPHIFDLLIDMLKYSADDRRGLSEGELDERDDKTLRTANPTQAQRDELAGRRPRLNDIARRLREQPITNKPFTWPAGPPPAPVDEIEQARRALLDIEAAWPCTLTYETVSMVDEQANPGPLKSVAARAWSWRALGVGAGVVVGTTLLLQTAVYCCSFISFAVAPYLFALAAPLMGIAMGSTAALQWSRRESSQKPPAVPA